MAKIPHETKTIRIGSYEYLIPADSSLAEIRRAAKFFRQLNVASYLAQPANSKRLVDDYRAATAAGMSYDAAIAAFGMSYDAAIAAFGGTK